MKAEFIARPDKPWMTGVRYEGREFMGTDAVGKLCRELGTGTLEIYRKGMLCMTVNVEKRKGKVLTEKSGSGLKFAKYDPTFHR